MSLVPMINALTLAVSCFTTDLDVIDTQYVKQGAVDIQQIVARRKIYGAVDKSGARKLENIFGGSVSDGSIAIHTEGILYIGDIYEVGAAQKQSYFIWNDLTYRVAGIDPWYKQTGVRIYLAVRHVTQDLV
jgi:hypothetical protein